MPTRLTADDARQSLREHAVIRGAAIHAKYGPHIGWQALMRILKDRECVRYPCEIVFDDTALERGEFAHPVPLGRHPEAGFNVHVHPVFMTRLEEVPLLVLYQLVLVNYGPFASADDAEAFGAAALGMTTEEYYRRVCALADLIGDGGGRM